MHSFIPSLLLVALASTAAGFPKLHGPVNHQQDSSITYPTGTGVREVGGKGFAAKTGAHGTGSHSKQHHSHTGTGGHNSATATLAARQLAESDSSFTGFPSSFARPTGTGGFPFPTGSGGFGGASPTGDFGRQGAAHASGQAHHSGGFGTGSPSSGFALPTRLANFKVHSQSGVAGATGTFPSISVASGAGIGNGEATGSGRGGGSASPTGGSGKGGKGGHSEGSGSATKSSGVHNSKRQFPSGAAGHSGGFPSMSVPTGTGFVGGSPTGGFGGNHAQGTGNGGFGGGVPAGTGFPSGSGGGFPFPTGSGAPFPTTFQTSVVGPSSAA